MLDIHNTQIKEVNYEIKPIDEPIKKINLQPTDNTLKIVCFKLDHELNNTLVQLVANQLYFSKSEILRWAQRYFLKFLSEQKDLFLLDSEYKFDEVTILESVSSKFAQIPLAIIDNLVLSDPRLYQSRSYLTRIGFKEYLRSREKIHTYLEEYNCYNKNKIKVIAFRIPGKWVDAINFLIKEHFYVSLSETMRMACQDLLLEIQQQEEFIIGEWSSNSKDILVLNEGPKVSACSKMPLAYLSVIDSYVCSQYFEDRTHFIILALKNFLETDFKIYTDHLGNLLKDCLNNHG